MNRHELNQTRLREICEGLAPGLSIAIGNKVYLFISSTSTKQMDGFAPRSSGFSQRGKVLISLELNGGTGITPIEGTELCMSLKTPLLGKDIILEESVMFHGVDWTTEAEKLQMLDTIRKEILDWVNKITIGFIT